MSRTTITGAVLDHVAHAVPHWQDVWDRYAIDFGAEWGSGGLSQGFAPAQLRFGNGAKIEILMPNDVEANDFLQRFLTRNGPGPHHLTFKVPDLAVALDRVTRAGFEPIGVVRRDPEWMEGFIHPKQASGVVVQLAQALNGWTSPPPVDFPIRRRLRRDGSGPVRPASLQWVVHAVDDLDAASSLFVDLLGGQVISDGAAFDHRWRAVSWGGPLGVRLVSPVGPTPTRLRAWLGGRVGRIHHLELAVEDPGGLPASRPVAEPPPGAASTARAGLYREVPPDANAGLRLIAGPD
jgi:catechol 2,3-dioxygenase-like lactoylglutathione lyase family enzyme